MIEKRPANSLLREDVFQIAAAVAETEASEHTWIRMLPSERARAIYTELRRIDAERAGRYRRAPASA
jgi:hypothetical protein